MSRRVMIAVGAGVAALLVGIGAAGAILLSGGSGKSDTSASASSGSGKGYLGLTVTASPTQGLRVASVETDGPAARAGIQVGDFIQSIDGQVVRTPEQLKNAVEARKPGTQVSITYIRADQELHATAKLTEAPANAQIEATPAPSTQNVPNRPGLAPGLGRGQLGVQVQNITPQLKQAYNLSRDSGIVVTQVDPGGAGDKAGLKVGDIIEKVNGRQVNSSEDAVRAILGASGQQVSIVVLRGTSEMTLTAQMNPAASIPGFDKLPPEVQQRITDLLQSRNLTPQQLQRLVQGQTNLRVGTVKSISSNSLTLTPLEGGGDVTYTLTSTTEYKSGGSTIAQSDIKQGNTVLVISLDGQNALGVLLYGR
jgi:membrane-associated protease RseP (regulator of RpoE activity)